MHEDAHHLTDLSTDLGIGLLQATDPAGELRRRALVAVGRLRLPRLRTATSPSPATWSGRRSLYAGSASWLTWLVGRPLIGLNVDRYAREAELRFSLMRVNEHIDAISLAARRGRTRDAAWSSTWPRCSRRRAASSGPTVRLDMGHRRLWLDHGGRTDRHCRAGLFCRRHDLRRPDDGGRRVQPGAFLAALVRRPYFSGIADWRATLLRVAAFRARDDRRPTNCTMSRADRLRPRPSRADALRRISRIGSAWRLHQAVEPDVTIKRRRAGPRHRRIRGAGKTLFFRAIAGLWPWGSGRIGLPAGDDVTFIPRTPYFPPGTLREVLAYPLGDRDSFARGRVRPRRLDGGPRAARADARQPTRWDRELGEDDQRSRLRPAALHKPRWVIIDEALDNLKGNARQRVFAMLERDLSGATIINIGRPDRGGHFFKRTLTLELDRQGPSLRPVRFRHA